MLYVKDLERMRRFYGEMLGVPATNSDLVEGWVSFNAGGPGLDLHAIPGEVAEMIEIHVPPAARENAPVKLIFEVVDVESERARLEGLGARTMRRAWQKPGEACDGVDPEGNVFQIWSARVR